MSHLPADTPARLRRRGLKVVEVADWQTRSRPASTGHFDYEGGGVLCHHDAMGKRTLLSTVLGILKNGRPDLGGPLCHFSLGRDGTVYVVAAGRSNHAGKARPSGSMAGGDGNDFYIGIEAQNDGVGEPWPPAQYDAYALLCAVLCVDFTGNSARTVRGHKETSLTGKIDPTFPMEPFRAKVDKLIAHLKGEVPDSAKEAPVSLNNVGKARMAIAEAIGEINRAIALLKLAGPRRVKAFAQIAALQSAAAGLKAILKRLPES